MNMNTTKIVKIALLTMVVFVIFALMAGPALAQKDKALKDPKDKETIGADKKIGTKQGMDVLKKDGKDDKNAKNRPTKFQMTMGVASIFVMIGVVKWL